MLFVRFGLSVLMAGAAAAVRRLAQSALLALLTLLVIAEALPKRRKPKPRSQNTATTEWNIMHEKGVGIIFILLILLMAPPIVSFLYNVSMDPATPTVVKNGMTVVQERTLGFLSARKAPDKRE